jgi:putative transposase
MKLDPVKVEWIVKEREKGELTNSQIAERMGVSPLWVKVLYRRYRESGEVPKLMKPGRRRVEPSEQERELVRKARQAYGVGAVVLEKVLDEAYGTHIPHNRIHEVLKGMGLAKDEPRKKERRKWVRYEREFSNSLWHADWTLIPGKGWMIAYLDDASRFIVGYGLFPEATSQRSLDVLKQAIAKWGRPASILTDRGIQFYAEEAGDRLRGVTVFERYLIENDIRHVLSRVNHPQTNGKVERFFGTVKQKLPMFLGDVDGLVKWYNEVRPHMSLNLDVIETPHQAFLRKMPKEGRVVDEKSGEVYHASEE